MRKAGPGGGWRRLRTPHVAVPRARLERGMHAMRPRATAAALGLFVAGFTLDDLRALRWPAYLLGIVAAVAVMGFGPAALGRRFALDRRGWDEAAYLASAARSRRLGSLALLVAVLGAVVWLVFFSEGVPPWAR